MISESGEKYASGGNKQHERMRKPIGQKTLAQLENDKVRIWFAINQIKDQQQ